MASVDHCLYCFEALVSHLEGRNALCLADIQQSWREYSAAFDDASGKKQLPALQRLTEAVSVSDSGSASSGSSVSLAVDTALTSTDSLPEDLISESPLFVTWNTVSRRTSSRSLRGCIGTFEAQELANGLSEYALTSALHDSRFPPIKLDELPSLEVSVTLLTDFEDAAGALDWTLGVHGLRISFVYHGRRFGATYLPDVAVEQKWTKEETVVSLMRKAGWMGRRDNWQDVDLKVVRYQGKKIGLEHKEYKTWREWHAANKGQSG